MERHPRASIFHTRGWLDALKRTYGYQPVVYTGAAEAEALKDGLVFCRIESRLTGRRLVSLPFSDHCEPLVETKEQWRSFTTSLIEMTRREDYKYVEWRPVLWGDLFSVDGNAMAQYQSFYFHTLDISPEPEKLFSSFHKTAVQQLIKRASREGISSVEGSSPEMLRQFYRLLVRTRRRHAVPPQPLRWFQNLVDCLRPQITIRLALKQGEPIAGIVTLSFKERAYYKYGCTDERFHSLGGLQLLLWKAITSEKQRGVTLLDMGRSDLDNPGLVTFKERWGSTRAGLTYYRFPPEHRDQSARSWARQAASYAIAQLPDSLLSTLGGLLYPHMG